MFPHVPFASPWLRNCVRGWSFLVFASWAACGAPDGRAQPTSATASLRGTVTNQVTGARLEGAAVSVSPENVHVFTSRAGDFEITGLSAGRHEVTVSYAGLDVQTFAVELPPGGRIDREVHLTAQVYQLEPFQVAGVREGNAAALTLQKNAPNLANILSMDAYGNVADGNIGNFLQRLPGVDQAKSNGDIQGFAVRGIAQALSTVSLDGTGLAAANAGSSPVGDRAYPIDNLPSDLIATVKLTKAPTPDMPADSLGGNVDLVTKSAFDVAGRVITYRAGLNYNSYRGDADWTPTGSVTVMDTLGAERRVGVAVTASYSKTANTRDRLQNSLVFAPDSAVIVNTRLRLLDDVFTRERMGAGVKLEFRPTEKLAAGIDVTATAFNFNLARNDYRYSGVNRVADYSRVSRAAIETGTVPRTTSNQTASLAPGYTATYEELLNATVQNLTAIDPKRNRMYKVGAHLRRKFEHGSLIVRASHNESESKDTYQQFLITSSGGVGVSLDTTADRHRPVLRQLYGPTIFAGSDLARSTGQLMFQPIRIKDTTDEVRADWKRELTVASRPIGLQAGAAWRVKEYASRNNTQTYTYLGADRVAGRNAATGQNDDALAQFVNPAPGYAMFRGFYPAMDSLNVESVVAHFRSNPGHFSQLATDLVRPDSKLRESVPAAYAMGQVRFDRLQVLAGARAERTDLDATGSLQVNSAQTLSLITREASYTKVFPGVHLRYALTPSVLLRGSWSTSMGRPSIAQQVPTTTVTTNANTGLGAVNANNTDLRPMFADNFDVSAEYYSQRVGFVSLGAFRKNMKDFIAQRRTRIGSGPDNGFGGLYADYELVTQQNVATARISGVEFAFSHDLTFLPGVLRGLSAMGTFTYLDTAGTFADGNSRLPGFKPYLANAGFAFKHRRWLARVYYNYASGYLAAQNADPTLRTYGTEDRTVDLNLQYRLRGYLSLFADVNNVFNFSPGTYIISKDHVLTDEYNGPRINVGVSGRF